jgi:hypothetical protein
MANHEIETRRRLSHEDQVAPTRTAACAADPRVAMLALNTTGHHRTLQLV